MNNYNLVSLCSPKLLKMLQSGKQFIIIGEHEPYYMHAYNMIRNQETKQETWTKLCEKAFRVAKDRWMEIQIQIKQSEKETIERLK